MLWGRGRGIARGRAAGWVPLWAELTPLPCSNKALGSLCPSPSQVAVEFRESDPMLSLGVNEAVPHFPQVSAAQTGSFTRPPAAGKVTQYSPPAMVVLVGPGRSRIYIPTWS